MPIWVNKTIVQKMENPQKNLAPNPTKAQDTVVLIPIPNYAIVQKKSWGDASWWKSIQAVSREISIYLYIVYRPPSKTVKIHIPEIPGSLSNINQELNPHFEENSPF